MFAVCFSCVVNRQKHLQNRENRYVTVGETLRSMWSCFRKICKKQTDTSTASTDNTHTAPASQTDTSQQDTQRSVNFSFIQLNVFGGQMDPNRTCEEGRYSPPPSYETITHLNVNSLHGFPNPAYEADCDEGSDPNLTPPPPYEMVVQNMQKAQSQATNKEHEK